MSDDEAVRTVDVRELYERHAGDVHRYLSRRLGDGLAADLTAETFRVAIQRAGDFDPSVGHPRAWLYGIASNLVRGHWRTERRRLRALGRHGGRAPTATDPLLDVEGQVDARSTLPAVLALVAHLTPDDRDLLTLVAWEGCSYAEAAEALGIPMGTVRSRLHRIRQSITPGGAR